ncbi:hypothetical protein [Wolbachia pipientis]|nr:hypothetical protein [Wolbachia pipientis]
MFVLFFFIPYFHPLFSCFSSGLIVIVSSKDAIRENFPIIIDISW